MHNRGIREKGEPILLIRNPEVGNNDNMSPFLKKEVSLFSRSRTL